VDATSTGDVPFNCIYFQIYRDEGVIYNGYSCNGTTSASLSASGGLSTGAKTGIGVGAGLGGCILIACIAAVIVYYRRRRAKKAVQAKVPVTTNLGDTGIAEKLPSEVEGGQIHGEESPPELQGQQADVVGTHLEMNGEQSRAAEMDGGHSDFSSPLSASVGSRTYPVEMPP
jgi:hypothetical protein